MRRFWLVILWGLGWATFIELPSGYLGGRTLLYFIPIALVYALLYGLLALFWDGTRFSRGLALAVIMGNLAEWFFFRPYAGDRSFYLAHPALATVEFSLIWPMILLVPFYLSRGKINPAAVVLLYLLFLLIIFAFAAAKLY